MTPRQYCEEEERVVDCPVCANVLTRKTAGGITVDACEGGCGGIWFDRYELMKAVVALLLVITLLR